MPSYALNQFVDVEEALCKQLLGLDFREQPSSLALPTSAVGYKNPGASCTFSSTGTISESRSMTSSNWTQHKEAPLPSRWNKMAFWSERAVSMVEGDTGGLDWASIESSLDKPGTMQSTLSMPTSVSALSAAATASSRYKTELCRTFSERGVCKYGSKCQFAHGHDELRGINRHPKYKTEPCRTFHSIGFCPYGIRCHFVHNNEDDLRQTPPPTRPQPQVSAPTTQRPPLLKQSFSFAGFPSTFQPLEPPLAQSSSFFRTPSFSTALPPAPNLISDLLNLAFPELDTGSCTSPSTDQAWDAQFLPSPDSGCSIGELAPTLTSPSQLPPSLPEGCPPRQSPPCSGVSMGSRSLSLTSLSDQEGGCGSSASSLSGSDSCSVFDGANRRLPIFSQLSVPDDGFSSEGSTGGSSGSPSFFL
ncbi:mRNA decay activator protein ZFP36L1-like isoform X1 [Astyanax mexicanus]|uniref:mRNA decay activator protein ZFP36 n=2 Tax=Astyanax mexicanus TaxID=7994 RepID=A0A8B9RBE9_ASTMX|nr:mRNA decay activator protein ZFP36L1-like isoform X1 [Astyanax mexicanus]